ncbi:MAG: nucleotide exchange factor GrpE [Massiliimalia sp.]|jgi:molecular chaperone GrpE
MKQTKKKKGKWFQKMADTEKNTQNPEVSEETAETVAQEESCANAQQLKELEAENKELKDKVLRQMAEFDNFKKRTAREKDDIYNIAKMDCVETVLGVIDNFERALQTECSDENFKKGVEMIFGQFTGALQKLGVEEIEALGKTFDPNLHNAVNQVQDDQYGENEVCQVFQKGYKLGDKVIRHAMVVVANP